MCFFTILAHVHYKDVIQNNIWGKTTVSFACVVLDGVTEIKTNSGTGVTKKFNLGSKICPSCMHGLVVLRGNVNNVLNHGSSVKMGKEKREGEYISLRIAVTDSFCQSEGIYKDIHAINFPPLEFSVI